MKNIKQFFTYMVVGALVIALSISCKSNEEPTDDTHSNHPPSGTYSGTLIIGNNANNTVTTTAFVTTSGGSCNISGFAYGNNVSDTKGYDITITKWAGTTSSVLIFPENPDIADGEATINLPEGTRSFRVTHYNNINGIYLYFELNGITYETATMTRQ